MANIYISSTLADLRLHREAVADAIVRLDHQPLHSYVATERRALDACLADIELCHCYVGILGWRYGSLASPHDRSYTELEYEKAGAMNIPRLIFLLSETADVTSEMVDDNKEAILRFRARVQEDHIAIEFSDHNELIVAVEEAIRKELGAGEPVPDGLPWSADRGVQQELFVDAIEDWMDEPRRPLVTVIHGGDYEAVERFIDRLDGELPSLLPGADDETPVTHYPLRWPRSFSTVDELKMKLHRYLCRAVLDGRGSTEDLLQALAQHPGVVSIRTVLLTQDWESEGLPILEGFLEFWRDLGELRVEHKVVVFLAFKYQRSQEFRVRKLFGLFRKKVPYEEINKEIVEQLMSLAKETEDHAGVMVLPELEAVKRSEVEEWARETPTREFCGGRDLEPAIRSLFERKASVESGEQRIPMEELADGLRNLLYQHNDPRQRLA